MTQPSEDDFRAEVEAALTRFAPRRTERESGWGEGEDRVSVVAERSEGEAEELERLRAYRAFLAEEGLAWVDGPADHGGRGLSGRHAEVLREVEAGFQLPDDGYLRFSVSTLCPTLLAHGTEEQQRDLLPRLRTAEVLACQLYSEPGAGSDLAGLSTRAVRDGEGWRLTGQKVWSSGAHFSDIGLCIARTDPDRPKHAGLTTFLVDLRSPGVEVRPIRQLTGGASFDEVFLTDVHVPDSARVGEVDGGWSVVVTSLLNERSAIGREVGVDEALVDRLVDLARHRCADGTLDERTRDRLADVVVGTWAARLTTSRYLEGGGTPGPELALTKLLTTDLLAEISDLAADVLGAAHVADSGEWGTYAWSELTLGLPGLRVGGGTDEILKNAVGERVLHLPKDAR
ncbi:acyl-CoA dehydrogenase family protein [Nocardioides hwasunensis]|uniref:Acyl-CoA dehydrogenase family protein n=1 Tax=Nocardioides hwasunensis TaxID=397258 RepID=A0ABR8MKL4_9ACTN|nr:acyl-CoA dehydrogenase family protein [Nocardioides hwasunensis]MBD3915606.1 acyl-CoA dehydrogenase family protein [Nocardioides hwasunensis]